MSLVDSIFWLSETILGKVYYDGSSSVDKALSSEAIRVSKQMNDQSLGLTRELMKHDFERMCIVYEIGIAMVHFFIYTIVYILLYKCRYTYYTLFLCL